MYDIHNPTSCPRVIYDGTNLQRKVEIAPGKTVRNVFLDDAIVDMLFNRQNDLVVTESETELPTGSKPPITIRGMWGLGDNVYQRPFIKRYARTNSVFLDTPWPEVYEDIDGVRFLRSRRNLRTQMKNLGSQPSTRWSAPPARADSLAISYRLSAGGSIARDMARAFKLPGIRVELDLPPVPPWSKSDRPIALVRPTTIRTEWMNEARNPRPEYVCQVAETLMRTHWVIAVADIDGVAEKLVGQMPPAHDYRVRGELKVRDLMALTAASDVVVGGVGWIVPMCLAARTRAFVIAGGQGGHNAPERIIENYWKHRITFSFPGRYCRCTSMRHSCSKDITDLSGDFRRFMTAT